jgi:hypothetical protein
VPQALLAEDFRREVLKFLVRNEAISDALRKRMLAWRRPRTRRMLQKCEVDPAFELRQTLIGSGEQDLRRTPLRSVAPLVVRAAADIVESWPCQE